jgi:hypothetical protein
MLKSLRTSPDGCLSDYRRDKLIAGELPAADAQAARVHLTACDPCAARVRQAEADAARFGTDAPRWETIAAAGATVRPRRRARMIGYGALAAAACVALVVTLTRPGDGPDTRTKGSARIGFFVKRGDATWAGKPGEVVRPGDTVQLTYSVSAPSYLAVVSADDAGNVQILYPDGLQAAPVPAGQEQLVPQSTILDAVTGIERVVALFCADPIDLAPVRRGWEAQAGRGDPPVPAGCHSDALTWTKRAP